MDRVQTEGIAACSLLPRNCSTGERWAVEMYQAQFSAFQHYVLASSLHSLLTCWNAGSYSICCSGFMRHCCRALVPSMLAYWGKIELNKRIVLHREIWATNQYFKTQILRTVKLSLWLSNINDNNERMRERLHFLARSHKSKHEVSFSLRRSIFLSALAGSLFGRCLERSFCCLSKTVSGGLLLLLKD